MAHLELIEAGVIDRNPDPGHRHYAAMFPHPLELGGGEMICTYNRGSAMYALDLTFHLARSSDGGRTWRDEGPLYDRSVDRRP